VQAAAPHHLDRLLDAGLGYRFLLGEGFRKVFVGHALEVPAASSARPGADSNAVVGRMRIPQS
jgi:hypothetical protein